ncbi:MAG: transposase [Candidatus Nitrosopolaris sp.]
MLDYKFRIYPNKHQTYILNDMIEIDRLFYNQSLEERIKDRGLKYREQQNNLPKKRNTLDALRQLQPLQRIHSQVLQDVLRRLDKAFKAYDRIQVYEKWLHLINPKHKINPRKGFPKFKRRDRYNSLTYSQQPGFRLTEGKLKFALVEGLVRIKMHRIPVGTIKTCTIIWDIDRWFACLSCDSDRPKNNNDKTAGIDVGLKNWMTLDSGEMIDRPRFQDTAIHQIKHVQRSLSRKQKGSNNRKKVKTLSAKKWRKVRLQRDDYCQKVTTKLAKRFQTIKFEKLNISNMVKGKLAKAIYDATWYKLRQLADYKSEVVLVDHRNTTQKCSQCGSLPSQKLPLSVRKYKCERCGLMIDRDHNAAINIKMGSERANVIERLYSYFFIFLLI